MSKQGRFRSIVVHREMMLSGAIRIWQYHRIESFRRPLSKGCYFWNAQLSEYPVPYYRTMTFELMSILSGKNPSDINNTIFCIAFAPPICEWRSLHFCKLRDTAKVMEFFVLSIDSDNLAHKGVGVTASRNVWPIHLWFPSVFVFRAHARYKGT